MQVCTHVTRVRTRTHSEDGDRHISSGGKLAFTKSKSLCENLTPIRSAVRGNGHFEVRICSHKLAETIESAKHRRIFCKSHSVVCGVSMEEYGVREVCYVIDVEGIGRRIQYDDQDLLILQETKTSEKKIKE